jgi:L-fucose mutarotase
MSPELMKYMMEMGHSDVLVLADANFPAASHARRYLKLEGVEITELLEAILKYYPLDGYVNESVKLMKHLSDEPVPEIWKEYETIIKKNSTTEEFKNFGMLQRYQFYKEAERAYVIVQTATTARYANIMLQKGVI